MQSAPLQVAEFDVTIRLRVVSRLPPNKETLLCSQPFLKNVDVRDIQQVSEPPCQTLTSQPVL